MTIPFNSLDGKAICPNADAELDGKAICPNADAELDGKAICPGADAELDGGAICLGADTELDGGAICPSADTEMDAADRRILSFIQSGFPLASRPYAAIGKEAGVSEQEAFDRIRSLRTRKIIRRIGANFQSAKLGFRSTLCSACVPEEHLENFVSEVNKHTEVTHNYLRNHHYNIWFTCIGPSWDAVCSILDDIEKKTGITINNLPAKTMYKIKVDFQI